MRFRQRGGKAASSGALFFVLYCFIPFTNTPDVTTNRLWEERRLPVLSVITDAFCFERHLYQKKKSCDDLIYFTGIV